MLLSFDIDGTLEMGDPAGPLSAAFVRSAQSRGWVIGSCSDRTLREQSEMWATAGIVPDFVTAKHQLARVRDSFIADRFIHFGDTHFARLAGFEFVSVLDLVAMAEWQNLA